ncbi:MAG: DUF4402 domain-containing protein [Bacteroidales bacterium]|nr:DUF4402 domain-containing protein [Bacteroidales bacterium]
MNFGNIAVSPTLGGTVVLPTAGSLHTHRWCYPPLGNGTVTLASTTVTGEGNSTYSITLPSSAITLTSPSGTMTVGTFEAPHPIQEHFHQAPRKSRLELH